MANPISQYAEMKAAGITTLVKVDAETATLTVRLKSPITGAELAPVVYTITKTQIQNEKQKAQNLHDRVQTALTNINALIADLLAL